MIYSLQITRRAQRELWQLPTEYYEGVRDAINDFANVPRPPGCRKLAGRGGWRIRIGPYRVIYEIDDANGIVTVLHIGHRRDVYR